jgi:CheY-like chemotaxis protein
MMDLFAGHSPALLIVDDSPTIRKMIRAALKPLNPMVAEAGSGSRSDRAVGDTSGMMPSRSI